MLIKVDADKRRNDKIIQKKRHDLYVVPFLFGMSLRGFPRCIAVLSYIQSWGMLLCKEDVYINWSSLLQEAFLGETIGSCVTANTTIMVYKIIIYT